MFISVHNIYVYIHFFLGISYHIFLSIFCISLLGIYGYIITFQIYAFHLSSIIFIYFYNFRKSKPPAMTKSTTWRSATKCRCPQHPPARRVLPTKHPGHGRCEEKKEPTIRIYLRFMENIYILWFNWDLLCSKTLDLTWFNMISPTCESYSNPNYDFTIKNGISIAFTNFLATMGWSGCSIARHGSFHPYWARGSLNIHYPVITQLCGLRNFGSRVGLRVMQKMSPFKIGVWLLSLITWWNGV
jgi:hypothetical protein